jgi:hypothetical protein
MKVVLSFIPVNVEIGKSNRYLLCRAMLTDKGGIRIIKVKNVLDQLFMLHSKVP